MHWKFGTRKDVSTADELRAELEGASVEYCMAAFRADPHKGIDAVVAARRITGEALDQSGHAAGSATKEEAGAQMAAAISAAVSLVAAMRPEPGTIIRASLYGHTVEPWEREGDPGFRPDEVTVVVNRVPPIRASLTVAEKPVLDELDPRVA